MSRSTPAQAWPSSSTTAEVRHFYEAHPYPAFGKDGMYAYIRMKRNLLQGLRIPLSFLRGGTILEAGCGTGESTLAFASFKPARAVGIDLSSASIERAKALAVELGATGVEFAQGDVQELGDLGGPFDLVMCEVLHQTRDPVTTLRGLVQQVRRGGYVVLSVANSWGNLPDVVRYRLVATLAGDDPDRRIRLAKGLFFNRWSRDSKVRGVRQRDFLNIDAVIADIYGHPYRTTFDAAEVLEWLHCNGLRYHASNPELGEEGGSCLTRLRAQMQMFWSNRYHLEIAAMRRAE